MDKMDKMELMNYLKVKIDKDLKLKLGEENINELKKLKKNENFNKVYYRKNRFKRLMRYYNLIYKDDEEYKKIYEKEEGDEDKLKKIKEFHFKKKIF